MNYISLLLFLFFILKYKAHKKKYTVHNLFFKWTPHFDSGDCLHDVRNNLKVITWIHVLGSPNLEFITHWFLV